MIILDTNVISELMERRPNPRVAEWAGRQRPDQLLTTAVNAMELRAGVERLEPGKRQRELADAIEWVLNDVLGNRVLVFDRRAANAAAAWFGRCRKEGRTIETSDTQIAGIAMSRRIPLATRNLGDFDGIDVKLIDPWGGK